MAIGYACILIGDEEGKIFGCTLKGLTPEKLLEVSSKNLAALEHIIDYNIKNNIKLFRISSDIIPFASHPVNNTQWNLIFKEQFDRIGEKIANAKMRVSMHPGQYTVINSPDEQIVKRAVDDLIYHCKFLDSLNLDGTHKIVLHVGGVYNDKNISIERFIANYETLPENIKVRLIIENDDRSYNVEDVLEISKKAKIPVVFDNLHHITNPPVSAKEILRETLLYKEDTSSNICLFESNGNQNQEIVFETEEYINRKDNIILDENSINKDNSIVFQINENKEDENNEREIYKSYETGLLEKDLSKWIDKCGKTWRKEDGKQKIHYSQAKSLDAIRSHSQTIRLDKFLEFYEMLENKDIDIMLEVKDKNLSALKCNYATNPKLERARIEEEWARYKYYVLSKSANDYIEIRSLFNNISDLKVLVAQFYRIIEKVISYDGDIGSNINAAQHVWGYINDECTIKQKEMFKKLQLDYLSGKATINPIKNFLYKNAKEQRIEYLINSLYFYI